MAAWAGRLKQVDMSLLTPVEVQQAGTAHWKGHLVLSACMDQRLDPGALQLAEVTENASSQAQKPEQAVGFEHPRKSVCVADQMQH